jgi:hypothetical protein
MQNHNLFFLSSEYDLEKLFTAPRTKGAEDKKTRRAQSFYYRKQITNYFEQLRSLVEKENELCGFFLYEVFFASSASLR